MVKYFLVIYTIDVGVQISGISTGRKISPPLQAMTKIELNGRGEAAPRPG